MNPSIAAAIERARQAVRERQPAPPTLGEQLVAARNAKAHLVLNEHQQEAVDAAMSGRSFCLVGSAGTGKTTTTRKIIEASMAAHRFPILEKGTKHLAKDRPGVVLIAYTRRAVRNIAKQMPSEFKPHCITHHKLIEYAPTVVETDMPDGTVRISKPFLPQRTRNNTLPSNLRTIIIDEASMYSLDFYNLLLDALPDPSVVQFIFIGDLNQLPPIYGDGILGLKLNELPVVELTHVYRQALLSPIIDLAIQLKNNDLGKEFKVVKEDIIKETPHGTLKIIPWKKKLEFEEEESIIHYKLQEWVKNGTFNPTEDVILCPWGKSFGTISMNKSIGTQYARQRGEVVYEVIAGFNKHYFSIGDRVLLDKQDAEVVKIAINPRYIGKPAQPPSKKMDYNGWGSDATAALLSADDIDARLDMYAESDSEDRTQEASHSMTVRFIDNDVEETITKAAEFNKTELAYAMSVHKSQGSEWQRVFIIMAECHMKMAKRELVYTAITRASKELTVIMPPTMLLKAAARPKIKGVTLEEKKLWFRENAMKKLAL